MEKKRQHSTGRERQITDENAKVYHFVPFASGISPGTIRGHQRLTSYCGTFTCLITARTPFHVWDGLIVATDDLRSYKDIKNLDGTVDTLILSHYRTWSQKDGQSVRAIPATTLKGTVRSVTEAITYSCICCVNRRNIRETRSSKEEETTFEILSRNCQVGRSDLRRGEGKRLCPACRIFGTLGFEGHVRFTDAIQESGGGRVARRPVPNSPNRRGTFFEKYHRNEAAAGDKEKWRLRGRKFYHQFDPLQDQPADLSYEPVEVCDKGSTFSFRIAFENLTCEELGALLIGLGQIEGLTCIGLGASKPFGYGSISIQITAGEVLDKDQGLGRLAKEFDADTSGCDWQRIIRDAIDSAVKPGSGLVNIERLRALGAIWDDAAARAEHGSDMIELWRKGQERLKPHP